MNVRTPEQEREALMPTPDEIHQMALEEGQPAENGDGYLFCAEEFDCFVQRLLDSIAAQQRTQSAGVPEGLLEWAVGRWHSECLHRHLQNVHRRSLDDTWRQVIRRLGGDPGLLCGPAHDALAAHDKQSGEVKP